MLAVALATVAALAWGASDFIAGVQSRRFDALAVIVFSQLTGTALLAIVVLAVGGTFPVGEDLAFILVGATLGLLSLLALYAALAVGTMSIVAPVAATGAALPVLVGLASGERPAAIQLAGIALALGGVVLASREPASPDATHASNARLAFGLALVASAGFGVLSISLDEATEAADPLPTVLVGRACAIAVLVLIAALRRPALPAGRTGWGAVATIGCFDVLANALYAVATQEGLLSVVSVLASLYSAVTVVLAHLLLHERLVALQRAGVVAALGGVAMIAAG